MKVSTIACLVGTAAAFPSMKEIKAAAEKRQYKGSAELLGDLATLPNDKLTTVGKEIKAILLGYGDGQSKEGYVAPKQNSKECKEDPCCIWKYINEELFDLSYDKATGQCNDFARGAIRMGFHDAAAWDKYSPYGGADGSLLLSDELTRIENTAMQGVGATMKGVYNKYKSYGISMADLLQAGAKVGVLACPGGPRTRMFIGRPDDSKAAPVQMLPPPFWNATQILDLFANKTVNAHGVVALLGAHTASKNHNPQQGPVLPQDKTPGKWDTEFFKEHLRPNASEGVIRFNSDVSIANYAGTKPTFQQFSTQKGAWDEAYAKEYIRMSLMGVKKINSMKECTKAMPKGVVVNPPKPSESSKPPHSPTYKPTYKPTSVSTIYQSKTITVTSCPPEKTNCPYGPKNPLITYTRVPVSTTIVDYTDTYAPEYTSTYSPEYPEATSPVSTKKASPTVVTAGAGRVSAGVFAAIAISFAAALL